VAKKTYRVRTGSTAVHTRPPALSTGARLRYDDFEIAQGVTYFLFRFGSASIRVTVALEQGTVELPTIHVSAKNVTSNLLDDIPVGEIRSTIVRVVRGNPALIDRGGREHPMVSPRLAASIRRSATRRRGPYKLTPAFLAGVALEYEETLRREPHRVILAMAKKRDQSPATVSSWIKRCRAEGWLTPAIPGKAGAERGPTLITWLAEQEGKR
jgi:hypothetical protein